MYKVYINQTPLYLCHSTELSLAPAYDALHLVARYVGKAKTLFNYIDMLEKTDRYKAVVVYSDDLDALWADFVDQYKWIEAAGGLVFNPDGKALLFYRRGFWDLPKGKIDPGETVEAAAVREVNEETGLNEVAISDVLQPTYHTYREKNKVRVLKKTFWFVMEAPKQPLHLQAEEDIERAEWCSLTPENIPQPVYPSILDVINDFLSR